MKLSEALTRLLAGCMAAGSTTVQVENGRIFFKDAAGLVVDHVDAAQFCCALLLSINNVVMQLREDEQREEKEAIIAPSIVVTH